jgi:hypothetical protein
MDRVLMLAIAAVCIGIGLYGLLLARWAQSQALDSVARIRRIPLIGMIWANPLVVWYVNSTLSVWVSRLCGFIGLVLGLLLAYSAIQLGS